MQARCQHDMLFCTERLAGYANLSPHTDSDSFGEQMADRIMTPASARSTVASFQSTSEGSVGSDTRSRDSSVRPLLFNTHAQAIQNLPDKKPDPSTVPPNSAKYEEMVHLARMYDVTKEKIKAHTANHLPVGELKDLLNFILYQNEKLLQADRAPTDKGLFASHYAEVKRTHNDLLSRIEFDTTYYKTGVAKEVWDLAAGFMAFFLCFGSGTLTSAAYRQPWLTMVITPTVWSLMERMAPMIRATSWRNPHADETIPKFMKLQERRARDWVRSWRPNLAKRQKTYPWTDPKTRESTNLTAAQYRKKIAIFSAWTGKVWTDDVVYLWYTFMYGSRVSLLYRYATPAFLATPQGFALSMFAMFAAGGTAGAATMFSMQQCRRLAYRHAQGDFKGGEVLTRSRDIWTAASIATQKDSELVEAKVQARFKQAHEGNALKEYLRCLKDEEMRAQSKSSILSSIIYELSPLVQTRRRRDDTKGEVAGKRIEAVSGFIAKNIALLPFFLFAQLVTQPYVNRNEQVPEHLMWVQYLLLIVGFSFRKELEIVGRVLSGLTFGLKDVINDYRGLPDGEETGDVVTEMPREHFGDRSNGPGEGGDPHDEDVMAPYRPQNLAGGQSDDESGDGTLSQAVSLNSPASSPDSVGNGSSSRRTRGSRVGDFLSPYAPRPGKKNSRR
jgi:hypothetical protein